MSVNVLNTKPTHYMIYRHENAPKAETHAHRITFQHSPLGRVTGWCHPVWAIQASYLILVDEEKHDGQNLQEEDEQEQNEELWRHKGKRRRRLSDWRHHLPGRNKKKTCRCGVYEEQIEEKEKDLRHHSEEGLSEQGAEREEQKQPAVARRDDQSERYRLFSHTCPNWRVKTHTQPRGATVPRY